MSRHHQTSKVHGKPQQFTVVRGAEWEIEEGRPSLFRRIIVPLLVPTVSGFLVDLIWEIWTKGIPWS
jgi:hypothetical protein